jgi:gamma-glutamylcysteine synthetase
VHRQQLEERTVRAVSIDHRCAHARTPCSLLQEDEALEALRLVAAALATAKLRHLNLSDNALGEKGVRAAAAALQPVSSTWCQTATACATHQLPQAGHAAQFAVVDDHHNSHGVAVVAANPLW